MHKWPAYSTREAALEHMTKMGRKYYPDELNKKFSDLTPDEIISHNVTVQKVTDEHFVPFLLAKETPEDDRRQRIVALKKRLNAATSGYLFRENQYFQ